MGRTLGIDYGIKRIGIAVSDPLGITAQPLEVVDGASRTKAIERIAALCREKDVTLIVVGMPYNFNGTPGSLAGEIERFAGALGAASGLPVAFADETLTTMEAERMLIEQADMPRERRKGVRDKLAAAIILQCWLDSHR